MGNPHLKRRYYAIFLYIYSIIWVNDPVIIYLVSLGYGAWKQRDKKIKAEKRNPDAIDAEYTEHDEEDPQ